MRISIAMATYNGEKYIIEQLDSLRLQTHPADEVIICDDRSSDNTAQLVKEYIKRYHLEGCWYFQINELNLGYADNFHNGLQKTTGDFVFFCDQDDIWCKDKIEIMTNIMMQHSEIQLLCCDFTALVSSDDAPHIPKKVLRLMDNSGRIDQIRLSYKNIYIASLGCLMAMSRYFIQRIEQYWYSGWAHDDYVWKLAQCCDGCYVVHKNLIRRRLHSDNVSMRPLHTIDKRISYLSELLKSDIATLHMAEDLAMDKTSIQVIKDNVTATKLRLNLFTDHHWINCIRLLKYANCYHSKKSILMEPWIILHSLKK